jgi:acetylornithine deacetylase
VASQSGFWFNGDMLPLPQLLAELVRLPSVNPMGRTDLSPDIVYEDRMTRFLEHEIRNAGCHVVRQNVLPGRDNILATYDPPSPAPFSVIFEAYTDTVPVDAMVVRRRWKVAGCTAAGRAT